MDLSQFDRYSGLCWRWTAVQNANSHASVACLIARKSRALRPRGLLGDGQRPSNSPAADPTLACSGYTRSMLTYVVRRLLYGVLTFFGITIAIFVLVHSVPGDPITFYVGTHGAQSLLKPVLDEIRHEHHLDESLFLQYVWWMRGIVTVDFRNSFIDDRLATERIVDEMTHTI